MRIIPLQPIASQILSCTLGGQAVQLNIYQKLSGLYCDIYISNTLLIGGVICQNLNRLVRVGYLGFIGDLMFIDNQGSSDPDYTGLGTRYSLLYLEASDLPAGVA